MLHAAVHRAPKGSIVIVESGDLNWAMCGGNVVGTLSAENRFNSLFELF
jgi:hypothetical protein